MDDRILVPAEVLREFASEALQKAGMPAEDAQVVAQVQLDAELRGPQTHGIIHIEMYVEALREGQINPKPNIRIVRESPCHALVDGDGGMGQLVSVKSMEICIAKAKQTGLAMVVAQRSSHFGAARNYPMMALSEDMLAFCATNAPAQLPPPGGIVAVLGINPFSFVFPAGEELPVILDMTCSVVARGKARIALDSGEKIPLGWYLDKQGRPTDDPQTALESHLMPPLGGGYKGFGLALVMEALTGALAGGQMGREITFRSPPIDVSQCFLVIDPQLFVGADEFKSRMDGLIRQIKDAPLQDKTQKTYLPGERGLLERDRKLREGVPMHRPTLERLEKVGRELGVSVRLL